MSDVVDKFVKGFTGYLIKYNLSDISMLEIVHPAEGGQPNECTAEIGVLGAVVVP